MYKQFFDPQETVGKTIQAFQSTSGCRERYIVSFTDGTFIYLSVENGYDGDSSVCLTDEFNEPDVADEGKVAVRAGIVTADELAALLDKREEDRRACKRRDKEREESSAKELLRKSGYKITEPSA